MREITADDIRWAIHLVQLKSNINEMTPWQKNQEMADSLNSLLSEHTPGEVRPL